MALRSSRAVTFAAASALLFAGTTLGCRVDKHNDGDGKDVKIATPFGGLSVQTNDATVQQSVGLAVYPGATLEKKEKGHDSAANVNLNFGDFHLGVKALSYLTPDSPEKVLAFYQKDLARFGPVLHCRDHKPVGTPTRTPEGLTCSSDDENAKVKVSDDDGDSPSDELKAGSRYHQHIVGVHPRANGTKIGLVVLDLPEHLKLKDNKEPEDKQ
jgi:hypothetical protein